MSLYDIHNPGRNPREFYDAMQNRYRLNRGERALSVPLDKSGAASLRGLEVIERSIPPACPVEKSTKTPLLITGHWGIGDNIHQRGPIRELMKSHEVWLETCHYHIYHDLVEQGLNLIMRPTRLRAQAKTVERERHLFRFPPPPKNSKHYRFYYNKAEIDQFGSIAEAMYGVCSLPVPERVDFSMPIPEKWTADAQKWVDKWDTGGRPLMLYRPLVVRREWPATSRNCDPNAYAELYREARDLPPFFVVSLADLKPGVEDIVGGEQFAHVKLHGGELDFQTMAGLFKLSQLVMSPAGFAPVLAQAVGTPSITVYGCSESFSTTERAGQHLAPTLGIDPDTVHNCYSPLGRCGARCQKHITLEPAKARLQAFVEEILRKETRVERIDSRLPEYGVERTQAKKEAQSNAGSTTVASKARTLIFGTSYIDSEERLRLLKWWLDTITCLNPDCDVMLVDSASPMLKDLEWYKFEGKNKLIMTSFPDNIGHLSRRNTLRKDGWGRAFSEGLRYAIEEGYEWVVHVESDSLFRRAVTPIIGELGQDGTKAASIPLLGALSIGRGCVETGLMFLNVAYLRESRLIERYCWQKRTTTPEAAVFQILGRDLRMMPWKGMRNDRDQVNHGNLLEYDWITHCNKDKSLYDKFAGEILKCKRSDGSSSVLVLEALPSTSSGIVGSEESDFWTWFETIKPKLNEHRGPAHMRRGDTFEKIFRHLDKLGRPVRIVETGCVRELDDWSAGYSTVLFDRYAKATGSTVESVDINPKNTELCRQLTCNTKLIMGDSVPFLRSLSGTVDLLYLDAMDVDWKNPLPSAQHHLNELMAALPLIRPDTLVVVDDCRTSEFDRISGKGALVAEYMQKIGASVVFSEYQVGWTGINAEEVLKCQQSASILKDVQIENGAKEKPASESILKTTTTASSLPTVPLLKLNLGCGTNKLSGWENHDADIDIAKPLPWNDGTAGFIFSEHCVEHISYYDAIKFFQECYRVLAPGGTLRITMPSIEQIYRSDDLEYFKFTEKWQKLGANQRGAMHAILYAHEHKAAWTASLLEATLFYTGFTNLKQCRPGESAHAELRGVEGHGRVIGDRFNNLESLVFEGTKPPIASEARTDLQPMAIVVGGGKDVWTELETAKQLCRDSGREWKLFVVNDAIMHLADEVDYFVTLHPVKVGAWLAEREKRGYSRPREVWAHEKPAHSQVDRIINKSRGSSGLVAVHVARYLEYDRVILCGVPMDMNSDHFIRKKKWAAAETFKSGWHEHMSELKLHVRSMSGWTKQQLGVPTQEWLCG
jgi:SAM-dependent methyltransferase